MTIRKIKQGVTLTGAIVASLVFSSSAFAAKHHLAGDTPLPPPPPPADTPAAAPAQCTDPSLAQQFSAFGDSNQYALVPGGTFDDLSGAGWQLTGSASIGDATRPDGTTGGVLSLTGGSSATSPVTCVTVDYPMARMFAQKVGGADAVHFKVSYWKNGVWSAPKETGKYDAKPRGWSLSSPLNVQPTKDQGWQYVKFTLAVNGDPKNNFQVDDFYVDPRSSR